MPAAPASVPTRSRRARWRVVFATLLAAAGVAEGAALEAGDILVTDASANKLYVIPRVSGILTELASGDFVSVPIGVAVRKDGFVFLTNVGSQLVVRIDPAPGPMTPVQVAISQIANARGIVIDPLSDDAFISVPGTGSPGIPDFIFRVDTVAGTGAPVGDSGLLQFPNGLVQEASGDLVVADSSAGGSRILRIHPEDGAQTLLASGGFFQVLLDIEIDPSAPGSFLVVDASARKVFRVDATIPYNPLNQMANQSIWAECPEFVSPRGIAVEADGSVLVSDFSAKKVFRINPTPPRQCTPLATGTTLVGPWDVTVAADLVPFAPGPLLVAGGTANQVYRVNPAAGTSQPVPLSFVVPVAVTRDLNGDLLVLENNRIRRVDSGGLLTTVSTFLGPVDLTGIVVQADGEILVADALNDRLVRVIPGPPDQQIVVADDTGMPSALLGEPAGLALDLDGAVLVANRGRAAETPVIPTGILRVNPISGATTPVPKDPTAQFGKVVAIAVDTNGDYLIADEGIDTIWRHRAIPTPPFAQESPASVGNQIVLLRGIALDVNRSILVSNQGAAEILRIDPTSGVQSPVAHAPDAFPDIRGIALDQPPPPPPLDSDGDGILESLDNCRIVANADQIDTNQDGFGNLCDADYNDNGAVDGGDFILFKNAIFTSSGDPGYDPDIDANSDGAIGPFDFVVFRSQFLRPPGPSGLTCAGSIPCP